MLEIGEGQSVATGRRGVPLHLSVSPPQPDASEPTIAAVTSSEPPEPPLRRTHALFVVATVLVALVGGGAVAWVTRHGVGLTSDSRGYVMAARSLVHGKGWMLTAADGLPVPLTHLAPLYPALLAGVARVSGLDVIAVARVLGVALAAINILLIAFAAAQCAGTARAARAGRSARATAVVAFVAAAVALTAPDVIHVHVMTWSESLFLCLLIAGFCALVRSRDPRAARPWLALVTAALLTGLAWACRYAGAAAVLAGAIFLLLERGRPIRRRFIGGVVFAVVASLPMAAWIGRNLAVSGGAANRVAAVHAPERADWQALAHTVSNWTLPHRLVTTPKTLRGLLAAGSIGGIVAWRWWIQRPSKRTTVGAISVTNTTAASVQARRLWWTFVVVYPAFILVSKTLFDAHIPFDTRIMLPMHVALLIVVIPNLCDAVAATAAMSWPARLVLPAVLGFLFVNQARQFKEWMQWAPRDGLGFASPQWDRSPLLAELRKLRPDAVIYTNGADLVYLRTGRLARQLPAIYRPSTRTASPAYARRVTAMRRLLAVHGGYVAYFHSVHRDFLATERVLRTQLQLEPVRQVGDGTLYHSAAVSPATQARRHPPGPPIAPTASAAATLTPLAAPAVAPAGAE